jgi:hypothetical protein
MQISWALSCENITVLMRILVCAVLDSSTLTLQPYGMSFPVPASRSELIVDEFHPWLLSSATGRLRSEPWSGRVLADDAGWAK